MAATRAQLPQVAIRPGDTFTVTVAGQTVRACDDELEAHPAWADAAADRVGEALVTIAETARRWKADRKLSVAAPLARLAITCPTDLEPALDACIPDLKSVTKAAEVSFRPGDTVALEIEPTAATA